MCREALLEKKRLKKESRTREPDSPEYEDSALGLVGAVDSEEKRFKYLLTREKEKKRRKREESTEKQQSWHVREEDKMRNLMNSIGIDPSKYA